MNAAHPRDANYRRGILVFIALFSVLTLTACVSATQSASSPPGPATTTPTSNGESDHSPSSSSGAPVPQDPPSGVPEDPLTTDAKSQILQACTITNAALANKDIPQRLGQEQQATNLARDAAGRDPQWSIIAAHVQTFHDLSAKEYANNGLPSTEKDEQINTAYTIRDECIAAGVEVVIPD